MRFTFVLILLLIGGCASTSNYEDRNIANYVVGQWEWEEGPDNCDALVNMAFKKNGTYTRTSESCDLADDGFGMFYYGWYVASQHICFIYIEAEFKEEKPDKKLLKAIYREKKEQGFTKESCNWKVEKLKKNAITILETYGEKSLRFTMLRKRWL